MTEVLAAIGITAVFSIGAYAVSKAWFFTKCCGLTPCTKEAAQHLKAVSCPVCGSHLEHRQEVTSIVSQEELNG